MRQRQAGASSITPLTRRAHRRYVSPTRNHAQPNSLIRCDPIPLPTNAPCERLKSTTRRGDPTGSYVRRPPQGNDHDNEDRTPPSHGCQYPTLKFHRTYLQLRRCVTIEQGLAISITPTFNPADHASPPHGALRGSPRRPLTPARRPLPRRGCGPRGRPRRATRRHARAPRGVAPASPRSRPGCR